MATGGTLTYLHWRSPRLGQYAFPPLDPKRAHVARISAMVGVVTLQALFYVQTLVNSPALPGNWAPLSPAFLLNLIYDSMALGAIGLLPLAKPKAARELVVQPGGYEGFVVTWAVFALLWTVGEIGYGALAGGVGTQVLTDTVRLQNLISFALMVAVSEELFFRVALTEYFGGILGSVVFGLFHVWVATVNGQPVNLQLAVSLGWTMFLGGVFFVEYRLWGIGAAMGSHAGVDVVASGAVGSQLATWLAHAGLTPF